MASQDINARLRGKKAPCSTQNTRQLMCPRRARCDPQDLDRATEKSDTGAHMSGEGQGAEPKGQQLRVGQQTS